MPVMKITFRDRTTLETQKRNEKYFKLSVKILGWSQIIDVFIYLVLFLYSLSSYTPTQNKFLISSLQALLCIISIVTLAYGILLIIAAYKESPELIHIASMVCLFLALPNLCVSILGIGIYCGGSLYTVHFIVMLVYVFLLLEIFWTLCFDFPHLVIYRQLLTMETPPDEPRRPPGQPEGASANPENSQTNTTTVSQVKSK